MRLAFTVTLLAVALFARPAAAVPPAGIPPASGGIRGAIEDDYARARAEARARGVPIVVDLWAPW